MLGELSEFKEFNYHLFDHWSSITDPLTLLEVELPVLRRFIQKHPANFSPYHVILTSIQRSADPSRLAGQVLDALETSGLASNSGAYSDFIVSLALLYGASCPGLEQYFDPFQPQIREYLIT